MSFHERIITSISQIEFLFKNEEVVTLFFVQIKWHRFLMIRKNFLHWHQKHQHDVYLTIQLFLKIRSFVWVWISRGFNYLKCLILDWTYSRRSLSLEVDLLHFLNLNWLFLKEWCWIFLLKFIFIFKWLNLKSIFILYLKVCG